MLLDHFHPPLKRLRHWTGFHSHWASSIATDLNRRLPDGWFAEPNVDWGIEVDVGTFEESKQLASAASLAANAGGWDPPEPAQSISFALTTDIVEVRVYEDLGDVPLAGAIEFVSPANKDRPESRDAFTAMCETYLREGVGLVIVDIVTDRRANLHAALMQRCGEPVQADRPLYTSGYRPIARNSHWELDIWYEELQVGGELPSMPLSLKEGPCIEVNLAETYRQTCRDLRIPFPDQSSNGG